MKTFQATWEDEETSRQVELVVNYQLDRSRVEINGVTPTRVTFLCPTSKKPLRTVGVHTNSGRRMLVKQAIEAGQLMPLAEEIAEGRKVEIRHDEVHAKFEGTRILQA
ncbi:MAG: hypothetical protein WD468_04835 [Pirellulales bacterium]